MSKETQANKKKDQPDTKQQFLLNKDRPDRSVGSRPSYDENGKRLSFNPEGRPSKHTPELLEKAKDYIETWDKYGDVCPTRTALCLRIGITDDQMYRWMKRDDRVTFSGIVTLVTQMQRSVLQQRGLDGSFSNKALGVMLSQHGLYEKTEQKNTSETTITLQGALADLDAGGLPKLPNQGKNKQITDRNNALTLPEQDNLKLVGSGKGK